MTPLVDQEVADKVGLRHIIHIVIVITEPHQPLTYHIQQLGDVLQGLGLESMHQELLSLEADVQREPAELLVPF